MTRVIFLGPPGAGKGTQAQILCEMAKVPHISTGDILRAAVKAKTELGKKAEGFMSAGELVPDDLILGLIRERLGEDDAANGWLLDGFPRNVEQANFLNALLEEIGQSCEVVINLEVPDDELVTRLLARGRSDDKEDVIRNRLEVYREQTEPLIDLYTGRKQLVSVNGNQDMALVSEELKQIVQGDKKTEKV